MKELKRKKERRKVAWATKGSLINLQWFNFWKNLDTCKESNTCYFVDANPIHLLLSSELSRNAALSVEYVFTCRHLVLLPLPTTMSFVWLDCREALSSSLWTYLFSFCSVWGRNPPFIWKHSAFIPIGQGNKAIQWSTRTFAHGGNDQVRWFCYISGNALRFAFTKVGRICFNRHGEVNIQWVAWEKQARSKNRQIRWRHLPFQLTLNSQNDKTLTVFNQML